MSAVATDQENLIKETKIRDGLYAIELLNFHPSFEKVITEIDSSIARNSHSVFHTDFPDDFAVLVPIGYKELKDDHWLCISKESPVGYKVIKIERASLVNVIPTGKRAVVLIDHPYAEAVEME